MAILKFRDENGNIIEVPAFRGDKGDKGDTGNSGVYVGSGDMPEDCNVQIDHNGNPATIESIAEIVFEMSQTYIDQQLGVIENGSY